MLIGKTFWKGLAMASYLYADEVLCFNKEEMEKYKEQATEQLEQI